MSQPTAGNFDCARLQEIKVRMSTMVNPNEAKDAEYIPDIAALDLAKATTGFRVPPELQDSTKDNSVKGIWMDDCDDATPEDCSGDTCVISGDQIGTECKDYELDQCFHKSFSVSENKFRLLGNTVSQDEEVAINMAKKLKLMDEGWATRYIQALDSLAGTNAYAGPYTVGGGVTTIPATAWGPNLFSYFAVAKAHNKMPSMKLFLGGLMEQALLNAELESETEQGRANVRKIRQLGQVFSDSFLTASVIGENAAFLVSNSALALATVARYAPDGAGREEISQGNKHIYYTIKSPNSGIVYDVIYQRECLNSDWINTWDISTRGAVLTNAVFCGDRPLVLKFVCA